jgi:hypothetical protein
VVRHAAGSAIYACSLVQAKRACSKFEAPTVSFVFHIHDAMQLRGVLMPKELMTRSASKPSLDISSGHAAT